MTENISLKKNVYKIIVFGDSNAGKTTLLNKLVSDQFNEKTRKTIGVEFRSKSVFVDNLAITLQIWDFSGETQFNFLFEMYCKGVVGGIFTFDLTNIKSLLTLSKWIYRVRAHTSEEFPILIVGTKNDLVENNLRIEDVINPAISNDKLNSGHSSNFFSCSAKTGENVGLVFQTLAERIYKGDTSL